MSDPWAQAEGERVQANLIRVGVVTEVDAPNARVKMKVGGLDTDWLPWGVARAGGTRTASAPTVGEQRLVFSPYGDTAQGVVGQAIYQDDHPTPAATGTQEMVVFPDGSKVTHDSASSAMLVDVAAAGKITLKCGASSIEISNAGVKIIAPRIDLNE